MLTIFTIPKAFSEDVNTIQLNALRSWKRLHPMCEIILFGSEKGVQEVATELEATHVPNVGMTDAGVPLVSSAFELARRYAQHRILAYVNSDIILLSDFIPSIRCLAFPTFLMVGRRWDLEVNKQLDFQDPGWETKLRKQISAKGRLHGPAGIDYFVFPRDIPFTLPPFAVGRPGWDNWMIYKARTSRIPVIDATATVTAIHQNHDYSHHAAGKRGVWQGQEAQQNIRRAGGLSHMLTLREADWQLDSSGVRRPSFLRYMYARLSLLYPWRLVLALKRRLL